MDQRRDAAKRNAASGTASMLLARLLGVPSEELEGKVLDVGSGHSPHWAADVLLDRFVRDASHRRGAGIAMADHRYMVCGDAERLPFRTGAFDYVHCSHVIEHVDHPDKVLAELSRVATAGYIETPSELCERLFGWPYHKWYVRQVGEKLFFAPKEHQQELGDVFHLLMSRPSWIKLVSNERDMFFNRLRWRGRIKFEICGSAGIGVGEDRWTELLGASVGGYQQRDTVAQRVRRWVRDLPGPAKQWAKRRLKKRRPLALETLLACPECGGSILLEADAVVCRVCGRKFPVIDGIPWLLRDERVLV